MMRAGRLRTQEDAQSAPPTRAMSFARSPPACNGLVRTRTRSATSAACWQELPLTLGMASQWPQTEACFLK